MNFKQFLQIIAAVINLTTNLLIIVCFRVILFTLYPACLHSFVLTVVESLIPRSYIISRSSISIPLTLEALQTFTFRRSTLPVMEVPMGEKIKFSGNSENLSRLELIMLDGL